MAGTFKVKPERDDIGPALARARLVFGGLRAPLADAATELTKRVRYRFSFKRDPDGNTWPEWSERTKKKYGGSPRTLMLNTKRLRDGTRFIAAKDGLRVTLGAPYGVVHEQPNGKGDSEGMPRRAFVFSYRNGNRALAKNDEKLMLNELLFAVQQALGE